MPIFCLILRRFKQNFYRFVAEIISSTNLFSPFSSLFQARIHTLKYMNFSKRFFLKSANHSKTLYVNAVLGFFLFLFTICFLGLTDFLFERSFTKFKWPSYVDVREQVIRELMGQNSEYAYLNSWTDFQPIIKPKCIGNIPKHLILFIHRYAIRKTWGRYKTLDKFHIKFVFVMGVLPDYNQKILEEQRVHDDLLVGNFKDNYYNNTYKFVYSIGYARNYCQPKNVVSYLILVDDDYLVNMDNLLAEIVKHTPNERLYMGNRFDTSPFRLVFQKYAISLSEYPYDAYPPFLSAGGVLLTGQTVKEFYYAIQHVEFFKFDDVYTAYFLGINPQHNENFLFYYDYANTDNCYTEEQTLWKHLVMAHGFSPSQLIHKYPVIMNMSTNTSGH